MSDVAVAVVGDGENGSVAEEGEGVPSIGSEDLDVASSKHPPSSAAEVGLSGADSATPTPPVKKEVKQEPDGPGDASPGTSIQPGTGDVSPNPKGTLLSQLQDFMSNNMTTMKKII